MHMAGAIDWVEVALVEAKAFGALCACETASLSLYRHAFFSPLNMEAQN